MNKNIQNISKLAAARRQLATAIELWFLDKDVVSIHTLAFAAYEIIHFFSKKRGRTDDLIFDSIIVKDEYRKQFNEAVKSHANFFKHASTDPEAKIDFAPKVSEFILLFAIKGLTSAGEQLNIVEQAYLWWRYLNYPEELTETGKEEQKKILSLFPATTFTEENKGIFFEAFLKANPFNLASTSF